MKEALCREWFDTVPFRLFDWFWLLGGGLVVLTAVELEKLLTEYVFRQRTPP